MVCNSEPFLLLSVVGLFSTVGALAALAAQSPPGRAVTVTVSAVTATVTAAVAVVTAVNQFRGR